LNNVSIDYDYVKDINLVTKMGQITIRYNNCPSNNIVNATYNVSYRSLLEADVTGRGYTPMLQTAVLIASFIVI
jgi:hypothetical protein